MENVIKNSICPLLYIKKDNKLLLARKKRGFGYGKYNGVGGKQQPGETIEQTMLRETMEEIGIVPLNYKKYAVLIFDEFVKDERQLVEVDVYIASDYEGEILESEEMKPEWFDILNLPYDNMFEDDKYFLPLILEDKLVKGFIKYDKDFKMLEHKIEVVENLE